MNNAGVVGTVDTLRLERSASNGVRVQILSSAQSDALAKW